MTRDLEMLHGHTIDVLRTLPAASVQCVVTSPPYWGLRSYLPADHPLKPFEIGQERTPEDYVARLVDVFREVWRVLRDDGVVWLNLGDCFATGAGKVGDHPGGGEQGARWRGEVTRHRDAKRRPHGRPAENGRGEDQVAPPPTVGPMTQPNRLPIPGLKPKDLVGIPWRVAFALQADGWWLRRDNVWNKPNPMPESTGDRCTSSHEYVFHLTKAEHYFYDAEAIKEPCVYGDHPRNGTQDLPPIQAPGQPAQAGLTRLRRSGNKARTYGGAEGDRPADGLGRGVPWEDVDGLRNKRSVWTIATQPYPEAHFATFPEALVEPCILAGSSPRACEKCGAPWERIVERAFAPQADVSIANGVRGAGPQKPMDESNHWEGYPRGTTSTRTIGWRPSCKCDNAGTGRCVVLDPFGGSGTVGKVALVHGRRAILIDLHPDYLPMQERRCSEIQPLLGFDRTEASA